MIKKKSFKIFFLGVNEKIKIHSEDWNKLAIYTNAQKF